jgi:predicted nuclease of predicted toxin-antitoxin system
VKLVLDEHLSPTIAEELRRRGHDVVAATEVGMRQQPDAALLAWAVGERRGVLTANYADFRALHETYLSRGEHHFGIVLVSRRFSLAEAAFGRLIDAVERLLKENPGETALESAEIWLAE